MPDPTTSREFLECPCCGADIVPAIRWCWEHGVPESDCTLLGYEGCRIGPAFGEDQEEDCECGCRVGVVVDDGVAESKIIRDAGCKEDA